MGLFRFELKKLMLNKKTIIILALLFLVYGAMGVTNILMQYKGDDTYEVYTELAEKNSGKLNKEQSEKSAAEINKIQDLYGSGHIIERMSNTNGQLKFDYLYSSFASRVNAYYNGDSTSDEINGIEPIKAELSRLEDLGETDTYEYKRLSTLLENEEAIGEPEFREVSSWESLFEEWGGMFILILLFFPMAFLIAPVFTMEASTGMDNIILSSKNGRRRLVTAKLGAVAVACVTIAMLFFIGTALGTFIPYMSLYGGGDSLRCISTLFSSQLNVSIFGFAGITVLWVLFVSVVFGFITSFVSCKLKNHAAVFGIGIITLLLNMIIEALGTDVSEALDIVVKLGFTETVSSFSIFGGTTTFNIFGMVVPYYAVALAGLTIFAGLAVFGIYHSQKKRTIA